jgi:uncharacterized protein (DUF3820 family)
MFLTDESPMPWGIYKNIKMANVPAKYLIGMYEKKKVCTKVKAYVEDNLDVLKSELKTNNK